MTQVPVASTHSRIGNTHSRITYFDECDIEAYYVTNRELAELCQRSRYRAINLANDELLDLIDRLNPCENRRVFM